VASLISCGEGSTDDSGKRKQGAGSQGTKDTASDSIIPGPVGSEISQITILQDESELLTSRWHLLNSAKKAVWVQSYIFKGDYTGGQFATKLIELKNKGLDVRVIVDEFTNFQPSTQSLYAESTLKGLKIIGFNPLYESFFFPLISLGNVAEYLGHKNRRSHEKIFMIDPQDPENGMAIIGGANISNDYFKIEKSKTGGYWRDRDVLVKGPIIKSIATYFEQSEKFHIDLNQRAISSSGTVPSGILATLQKKIIKQSSDNPDTVAAFQAHLAKGFAPSWIDTKMKFLVQNMTFKRHDIYNAYLDSIKNAKTEILIGNGYFIPEKLMRQELVAAAARGVKVKILTNSEESTDFPQIARAGRLTYAELLSNTSIPLEVYEWGLPGAQGFALYHSKHMCVDKVRCIVGSYNFDPRSKNINNESAVIFEGEAAAASVVEAFYRDIMPTTATKITKQMADSYSNPTSVKEKLMNAFIRSVTINL
jgi:putative cardiolipin synthase